jgi:hypothetical protein
VLSVYDATLYGSVGQWVGAVGTTAAFGATFYVILRDANLRRKSQARKVAFYIERTYRNGESAAQGHNPTSYDYTVHNQSDEPIYSATIYVERPGFTLYDAALGSIDWLLPDKKDHVSLKVLPHEVRGVAFTIFRDNSGDWWRRDTEGRLKHLSRFAMWRRARRWKRRAAKPRRQPNTPDQTVN